MINHQSTRIWGATFAFICLISLGYSQCPAAGSTITGSQTISSNCTVSGNLTINGGTLTINSGVILTVTGTLTLRGGGTINATSATINGGSFADGNSNNTLTGGTYNLTGFTFGNGGNTTINGVTVNLSPSSSIAVAGGTIDIDNSVFTGISTWSTNVSLLTIDDTDITGSGDLQFEDTQVTNGSITSTGGSLTTTNSGNTFTGVTINAASSSVRVTTFTDCDITVTGEIATTSGTVTYSNSTINAGSFNSGSSLTEIDNGSQVVLSGGFNLLNQLIIDNALVDVGGDLDASGGDDITVRNNGELIVRGSYQMNGGGIQLSVESGSKVRVFGDVESNNGGNSIDVDDNSGISVGGDFIGSSIPTVSVGSGDDGTTCLAGGGCCGDASACGEASILPVSLMEFNHTVSDGQVTLGWSTASELNNDFFTLERSLDGINFSEICEMQGAGTVNEVRRYTYSDHANVLAERLYYRLSQTDFDGTHVVLGIISVSTQLFEPQLKVYPNPAVNTESIVLSGAALNTKWMIYSLSGELVRSGQLGDSGKVSVAGLKAGTYILKVDSAKTRSTVLIIK